MQHTHSFPRATALPVFLLALLALLLPACSSTASDTSGGASSTTARSSAGAAPRDGEGLPPASREGVDRSAPARHVVLTRAKTSQPLILVNASHPWRFDRRRQLGLALGQRGLSYKVIDDELMDEFMEALHEEGWATWSSRFAPGEDARWFEPVRADDESFRGMLYVDDDGTRRKFLRMKGEQQGVFKWQDYHGLFHKVFAAAGRNEMPGYNVSTSEIQGTR